MKWAAPENMRVWAGRFFSAGSLLMVLAVAFLLISELRFDWAERIIGRYLVGTNERRPESGHIWEIDQKARKARKTLEQIVTDRLILQRETFHVESMSELAGRIEPGEGVMISPDHFRKMYLRLPPFISDRILPPMDLLAIFSGGEWERTYCARTESGLLAYLLGADNRVLREIVIDGVYLEQIDMDAEAFDGILDEMPEFRDRIIPSGLFFDAINLLPEDVKSAILPDPNILLQPQGRLTRVGFPAETAGPLIVIGFEFESEGIRLVMRRKALGWAVALVNSAVRRMEQEQSEHEGASQPHGERP